MIVCMDAVTTKIFYTQETTREAAPTTASISCVVFCV